MNTPLSEKQILITGGNGMLGQTLRKHLMDSKQVPESSIKHPSHQTLDITRTQKVRAYILQHQIDIVINCAAYTDVDGCEVNRDHAMSVNAKAAGDLAKITSDHGVPFVHYSTDYVFDGSSDRPYQETDPTNPINQYGRSKEKGEKLVLEHHPDALIIRTAWLYGKGGGNFVKTIYEQLDSGEDAHVVSDQRGAPTWTRTVAQGTLHLLRTEQSGIFHVSDGGSTTWYEVARVIGEFTDTPELVHETSSEELDRKADRPQNSLLSTKKLQQTDFHPLHWKENVNEFLRML